MRFAVGTLATAVVLFVGAAVGVVDSWAFPLSAVVLLMAAVVGAIAADERDVGAAEHRRNTA